MKEQRFSTANAFRSERVNSAAALAPGSVVGNVLFERVQFVSEVVHAPLQQVSNGENPEQFPVVVGHREMAEVPFQHDAQRLAGTGAACRHLNRRGHQVTDRRCSRINMAKRHLAQHVAFGENPRDTVLVIYHRDGADVMVQHFVNGIGHGCFQANCRNLTIAKLKNAHQSPPPAPKGSMPDLDRLNRIDALCSRRSACQENCEKNQRFPTSTKVGLRTDEGVRLDLHQNLGRNYTRYLHHRSGRLYVVEIFAVGTPDLLPLRDVHNIDARAYDILHAGSRLRERALNILERLHCLRLNVPYADDLAIRPGRRGSRNMDVRSDFYRARVADDRLPRCAARNVLTLHATLRGPQFYKSEMSRSVGVDSLELLCALC